MNDPLGRTRGEWWWDHTIGPILGAIIFLGMLGVLGAILYGGWLLLGRPPLLESLVAIVAACAIALVFEMDAVRVKLHQVAYAQKEAVALLEELAHLPVWDAMRNYQRREQGEEDD